MKAKSWHLQAMKYQNTILGRGGMNWGEFMKRFKQPSWCAYFRALEGGNGCWSLITPGRITNKQDCGECEYIRK